LTRTKGVDSRPLGIKNARILSISSSGEMAILFAKQNEAYGTLAQVSLSGGSPRELLDHVTGACWNSDGSALAVTTRINGKGRLEFPVGHVLYESSQHLRQPRISPDGKMIAFREHVFPLATFGSVGIIDLKGKKIAASGMMYPEGIGWAPAGEVWFTSISLSLGGAIDLRALTTGNQERVIQRFPSAILRDISSSGNLLLESEQNQGSIIGLFPGDNNERDLSWLDGSSVADISRDAKTIVIFEGGEGSDLPVGTIYTRSTDGSPAVRIGAAAPTEMSSDGKYILGYAPNPYRITILPTGVRETKIWKFENFESVSETHFFADERRVLFTGKERGHSVRVYAQEITGGKPQPITPEGFLPPNFGNGPVSPDGKLFFGVGTDQKFYLYSVSGAKLQLIPSILAGEIPFQWNNDGSSIYVSKRELPCQIYRVNIQNGNRTFVKKLLPSDSTGVTDIGSVVITPDEKSFVYSYGRTLSTLYSLDPLK